MNSLLTHATLLEYWEDHRRVTRRTIEAFPDDQLFGFQPAPPMRSFGEMMLEVINIVEPNLRGWVTGEWKGDEKYTDLNSKQTLLNAWDQVSALLHEEWGKISEERLLEVEPGYLYGGPPQPHIDRVLYLIDNEIHHRAQGFVYLRLLGLEPPLFYGH